MKVSFVSTSAISQTLRFQMMRMQADLVQRQEEATTLRLSDPGKVLGARAGSSFSMTREITRLEGLIDSNSLAGNRLKATQDSLTQLGEISQGLLSTLTAAMSGVNDTAIVQAEAKRALESMTSVLNGNFNGEYLFAGIDTDVKPLNDFTDPASPNKAQFDAQFLAYFGFSQDDPAAAGITAGQIDDFLDTVIEPSFMGAGWQTAWSNASDQRVTSRIAPNETAQTSMTANGGGMRKLAMTTSVLSEFLAISLGDEARQALYKQMTATVGEAVPEIASAQSEAGVIEKRVKDASERISSQIDLYKMFVNDLEGVDPFEASTRVNELLTQIETSYALTARIQQLSLLRYLP
ncbi:flagellar hook-associated family protein [Chelativorans sp. AA-79]|uniref:flagellar hook-associated family protein n=1 Tax=Chelativorans sp. AA-79 TaxID=3028735 RepID=UPI0023F8AF99|nr:flagellar hook-associated family protein [Chelativorans sp. AA-79]WEX08325.1 flagellar hook-associated family protein [Chelativorans sp. AA-79]